MVRALILTSVALSTGLLAAPVTAMATSYKITYTGHALAPAPGGEPGIPGVTILTATWTVPYLPPANGCLTYFDGYLTSFSDGVNSLKSLTKAGYAIFNVNTSLYLCSIRAGKVASGKFGAVLLNSHNGNEYAITADVNDSSPTSSSVQLTSPIAQNYDVSYEPVGSFKVKATP